MSKSVTFTVTAGKEYGLMSIGIRSNKGPCGHLEMTPEEYEAFCSGLMPGPAVEWVIKNDGGDDGKAASKESQTGRAKG